MSIPVFSDQKAQALVAMVNRAPLQNMQEAAAVSQLTAEFLAWHRIVTAPKQKQKPKDPTP